MGFGALAPAGPALVALLARSLLARSLPGPAQVSAAALCRPPLGVPLPVLAVPPP